MLKINVISAVKNWSEAPSTINGRNPGEKEIIEHGFDDLCLALISTVNTRWRVRLIFNSLMPTNIG